MAENRTGGPRNAATRAAVLLLLAVLALVAGAAGCALPPEPGSPAEVARQQAEVAQADRDGALARLDVDAAQAEQLERDRWRPWRVGAWQLVAAAVPVLLVAAAVLFAWSRRGLVMPRRADGALPWRLRTLTVADSRAALGGRQAADLALASQAQVPHTLTWSPRSEYRNNVEVEGGELPVLPPAVAPAFRDLHLDPRAVYLGAGDAGPVVRPWEQLLTLALGGQTGSGKTWTAVSLTLQALAGGHRVALADPHSANPESLAARLAPVHARLWRPVATTDAEISAAADAVERVLRARAEGRDGDLTPVTFVVDELTKTMRGELAETIARILESIAAEGRKLCVRAILLGQRWSASRTGGSGDLRDTIPDVLLHKMRRIDARMLSGWPIDDLPDTSTLAPGECFLLAGEDVVRVRQPRMSAGDVAAFAAGLAGPTQGQPASELGPTHGQAGTVGPPAALPGPAPGPAADGFAGRAVELYAAGDSVAEITDVLSGSRARNGGTWKRTRERVEAALRDELTRSR